VPDQEPGAAEDVLAELAWRRVTWRDGTKGKLSARFAATRIRVADGAVWANNRHLPGTEAWLVGECRSSGGRKYYLSNLPSRTSVRRLAGAIKARWVCEQAHQQLKGELGLGHCEGRSWTGLHRPALMTCIAYAFLQHMCLAGQPRTRREKNLHPHPRTAAAAEPARRAPRHHRQAVRSPQAAGPMPLLQAPLRATA
jgi:SRSO17 transposase